MFGIKTLRKKKYNALVKDFADRLRRMEPQDFIELNHMFSQEFYENGVHGRQGFVYIPEHDYKNSIKCVLNNHGECGDISNFQHDVYKQMGLEVGKVFIDVSDPKGDHGINVVKNAKIKAGDDFITVPFLYCDLTWNRVSLKSKNNKFVELPGMRKILYKPAPTPTFKKDPHFECALDDGLWIDTPDAARLTGRIREVYRAFGAPKFNSTRTKTSKYAQRLRRSFLIQSSLFIPIAVCFSIGDFLYNQSLGQTTITAILLGPVTNIVSRFLENKAYKKAFSNIETHVFGKCFEYAPTYEDGIRHLDNKQLCNVHTSEQNLAYVRAIMKHLEGKAKAMDCDKSRNELIMEMIDTLPQNVVTRKFIKEKCVNTR